MKNESFLNFLKTMQQKSAITEIKTGDAFNYDTPTSFLLQKHYGKSINSYIYHKELFIFPLNQLVYVYILKDDNREKAASYFNESNGYVKQVLDFYYKQKDNNRYPFYISPLKAINHYFLNELDEIDKCFKKPT